MSLLYEQRERKLNKKPAKRTSVMTTRPPSSVISSRWWKVSSLKAVPRSLTWTLLSKPTRLCEFSFMSCVSRRRRSTLFPLSMCSFQLTGETNRNRSQASTDEISVPPGRQVQSLCRSYCYVQGRASQIRRNVAVQASAAGGTPKGSCIFAEIR